MEQKSELSFNCAETVLLQKNREQLLPTFNESCLRIASVFGGGMGGSGEVCGAVSGAVMCLGLALGTTGEEMYEDFKKKREVVNNLVKEFMLDFAEAWGSVRWEHLLAMDEGKVDLVGTQRDKQKPDEKMCNDYVTWAFEKVCSILRK